MALLNPQQISSVGTAVTFSAASAGGDTVACDGHVFLNVRNASGSAVTVTLATPGTVDGDLAVADRAVSVPATTGERWIGPLNPAVYGSICSISYSATASVTVAAVIAG